MLKPFSTPIYVTQPLLPDLIKYNCLLRKIWKAKWLTNMLGPCHHVLETKLSQYLKVPHLSLFNNGTNALITAIQALDLTGEVITTPFTFAATPHSLVWNHLQPVFVDIDEASLTMNPSKIEAAITKKTTGILGVHVFGNPCDVTSIKQLAQTHHLKVVYDAAHAFGTTVLGQGIGNYGDITMFSFHATKLFHTAEGGALTYQDEQFKDKLYYLKNFGIKNEEEVITVGSNGKMNEIQAALGLAVLELVAEEMKARQKILKLYQQRLSNQPGIIFTQITNQNESQSFQYFVIRIDSQLFGQTRDQVYVKLRRYHVYARKYFYPLCSRYQCYRHLPSSAPNNLPIATKIAQQVISLPFYGRLTPNQVNRICDIILKKEI